MDTCDSPTLKPGSSTQSSRTFKDSLIESNDTSSTDESSSSGSIVRTTSVSATKASESQCLTSSKDAITPTTEIKVKMKIGELTTARKRNSLSSVYSAVKAA